MVPIGVAIILILCAQCALIAEGVKDDVCNGYFDYFDCVLQCFGDAFNLDPITGDFCEKTVDFDENAWAFVHERRVVRSLRCITEKCRWVVPSSVCHGTCGDEEEWHWHPPPWKHKPWKPHPWTPKPWTPPPWTPPPWTQKPWTPPPWTPKPWTPWKKPHHHHGGSGSAAAAAAAASSSDGSPFHKWHGK